MAGLLIENIRNKNMGKTLIKGGSVLLFICYFIFLFIVSKRDKNNLNGKHVLLYLAGIIFPLVAFSYIIFSTAKDQNYLVLIGAMILFFIGLLASSYLPSVGSIFTSFSTFMTEVTPLPNLSLEMSFLVLILFKILFVVILMVGLSIVYTVFLNEGYRQQGNTGFFLYLLFYIPCLISDYVTYLFREFKSTPSPVYILIALEIIFVLMYIFIPTLLNKIAVSDGQLLINNPMSFYDKQLISGINPFFMEKKDMYSNVYDEKLQIRRSYSISMWITTNNPTFGRDECMMFRFGKDGQKNGCPYISCTNEGKWKFVVSNAETQNENDLATELFVPMQRWNFIVLNYHDNDVDIFINGQLIETIHLENSLLPKYENSMEISIGSDFNELHGAICNVNVFPRTLTSTQISQSYNILRMQNPPVNNLK